MTSALVRRANLKEFAARHRLKNGGSVCAYTKAVSEGLVKEEGREGRKTKSKGWRKEGRAGREGKGVGGREWLVNEGGEWECGGSSDEWKKGKWGVGEKENYCTCGDEKMGGRNEWASL